MLLHNSKFIQITESAKEDMDRDFLPALLSKMIFPNEFTKDLNIPPSPTAVLSRLIDAERYARENPGRKIPDTTALSAEMGERLARICDAKVKPLQVGAMLYALYWLPWALGDNYATVDNAAKMVATPFCSEPVSYTSILKNLSDYSSVAHYWAAFLVVVQPNNYLGIWDEADPPHGIEEDSLYDFINQVDLKTFLGYAAEFLRFRKKFMSSAINKKAALIRENLVWVTPLPLGLGSIAPLEIPNLWGADYPFERFRKEFDDDKSAARQKETERRHTQRRK